MLGGYQILDLRNIDLSRSASESSITDVEVLKQLSQIADHIQKTYDFSKSLHNQLKPVLIRYRDKKVGEKHEVALYGNIEVINVYYKFRIIANNEGEKLAINVEFEEKTDEYDNKYWSIKTAKILLTSAQPIFEEITDKDGHKRFIEGDIEKIATAPEGLTFTYAKWSLSGSHLLIVVAGTCANNTVLVNGGKIAELKDLPEWVIEKIAITFGGRVISSHVLDLRGNTWNVQTVLTSLNKETNVITIRTEGALTLTDDRYFRLAFDLLIDNESQD